MLRINRLAICQLGLAVCLGAILFFASQAHAFQSPSQDAFNRAKKSGLPEAANELPPAPAKKTQNELSILNLMVSGGWFMIPLVLLSIFVVLVSIERTMATRNDKILPRGLAIEIGKLSSQRGGFDPRDAYKICQRFPSSASRVVQSMLQRVGRPMSEVESAVNDAAQREAERVHSNVRWLVLAAAVAPLMGLLGTVWGMIQAFYDTSLLTPDQNKAEVLSKGIYAALVTTLFGLIIAIPSAVCAHFFESRITKLFHQIEEFVFNLMPQVEKYEGQLRFNVADASSPSESEDEDGERPKSRRATPAGT